MVSFRTADIKDIPALHKLWKQCFGDSDSFCNWFFTERFQPGFSTVAEESGQVLSAIHGWPFTLRIRNKTIPSIMMCGVSTHPSARGRGLMRGCLSLFTENARQKGFLALFQKPVDFEMYRWCLHYTSYDATILTGSSGHFMPSADISDILCSEASYAELLPVYEKSTASFSCCVIRSADDMRLKLRDYAADGGRLVRYAPGGRVCAYAIYYLADTVLAAPEVIGDPANTAPVLHHLAAVAGHRQLSIKLPAGRIPEGFVGNTLPCGAMTALDVPALLRKICGFDDISLAITDPIIPQNNGIFTFSGIPASHPQLRLDAGRLMQLLSGYADIDTLAANGHATLLSPVSHTLMTRLPSLPCFTVEEY